MTAETCQNSRVTTQIIQTYACQMCSSLGLGQENTEDQQYRYYEISRSKSTHWPWEWDCNLKLVILKLASKIIPPKLSSGEWCYKIPLMISEHQCLKHELFTQSPRKFSSSFNLRRKRTENITSDWGDFEKLKLWYRFRQPGQTYG